MDARATSMQAQLAPRGVATRQARAARVASAITPALAPARYVRIPLFEALTGYSAKAVEGKIATGAWVEGREYKRAPDGHTLVDMKGYERWVEAAAAQS
jgi:hypothetical protein